MALNIERSMLGLALLSAAALHSLPVRAADQELLDMLLKNGAITQEQHDTLMKKETISKQDVDNIKVKLDRKGLQVETADKAFKFALGGRIQADATWATNNNQLTKGGTPVKANDGTEIRRGRMAFKGVMWHDWKYVIEADFADNKVHIKDLFVTWKGLDHFEFTAGNQKQPISMELQESSNDIMFTERSLVNSLTGSLFDRAIGSHAKSKGHDWSTQVGVYGDTITPNKTSSDFAGEGWGVASRVTWAPINADGRLVHLGTYGGYRAVNGESEILDKTLRFRHETTHMSNLYLTDTGKIADVDSTTMAGAELAGMYGPFSAQFEYANAWVNRSDMENLSFSAWYIQAAWTLTGESRSYKGSDGEFKRLRPERNFSLRDGGWGALELAARYGQNDLNSNDIVGGRQDSLTVALNWYVNQNVRFMADYRTALNVKDSPVSQNGGDPDGVGAFTLRTQLAF